MEIINYILENIKEITGLVIAIIAIYTYKLKVKAEVSLIKKNESEIDIKLIKQFSELLMTANARSGYVISENAIQNYFDKNPNLTSNSDELKKINQDLEDLAILTLPVGLASQNATAIALTDFAIKHTLLKRATKIAIEQLPLIADIKKECLNKLN